jgi:hypothetical protein
MRKIIYAAAAAILILTSCATDVPSPEERFVLERHYAAAHPGQPAAYRSFPDGADREFYCALCGREID